MKIIRYGFRLLIEGKCADILQPDITWLGGITEVIIILLYLLKISLKANKQKKAYNLNLTYICFQ